MADAAPAKAGTWNLSTWMLSRRLADAHEAIKGTRKE
jgi:hypothetical protein